MTLTAWQDLLGAVRDGDVTIDYLTALGRSAAVVPILRAERSQRKRDDEKFMRLAKRPTVPGFWPPAIGPLLRLGYASL